MSGIEAHFQISVQAAVRASMLANKPLFVFLEGEREASWAFAERLLYDGAAITSKLQHFVCLRLVHHTAEFGYFQQIFPNLQLPSFYIVSQGKLLDVITEDTPKVQFEQRLDALSGKETNSEETPVGPGVEDAVFGGPGASLSADSSVNATPSGAPISSSPGPSSHQQSAESSGLRSTPKSAPSSKDHDKSVRQHKEKVAAQKREEVAEKQRIRALLDADRRERDSQKRPCQELELINTPTPSKSASSTSCSLVIRLFDGRSMKGQFLGSQTLNDVRSWLDGETDGRIIPDAGSSIPSFATASHPQPTHYVFHSPALPRTTFTDAQEFQPLSELRLTPRSVLILKPIYDDMHTSSSYPNGRTPTSMLSWLGSSTGRLANALYSFFDYGVDDVQLDTADDLSSSSPDEFTARPHSNSLQGPRHPSLLSIRTRPLQTSLLSIAPDGVEREDVHPNSPRVDALASNFTSRSSTPKPLSIGRILTIRDEDGDKDKKDSWGNGNNVTLQDDK